MDEPQRKLFEAAAKGCTSSLVQLLENDNLILDRAMASYYSETPLHVAAISGHVDFVKKMIELKPELAKEVNSQRSSPLHLASARGHVGVVKALVSAHREMCLARDRDGLTPLHLAAIKGREEVVKVLVEAEPDAAQLTVFREESVLHLCVKHNQLQCLKIILETVNEAKFVNSKDADGNTILHLAVADKQVETTNFLVSGHATGLQVNEPNLNGLTAMDVLIQSRRDMRDSAIEDSLKQAGAIEAGDEKKNGDMKKKGLEETLQDWLEKKKNALMVVASLIATMGFQIGVNPPGGVWQDDNYLHDGNGNPVNPSGKPTTYEVDEQNKLVAFPHRAGYAVLATRDGDGYELLYLFNTISFISSFSIIFLLMSGFKLRNKYFMGFLIVILWVAISTTAITYNAAVRALTPGNGFYIGETIAYSLYGWIALTLLIITVHTIRLLLKMVRKLWGRLVELVSKLPWLWGRLVELVSKLPWGCCTAAPQPAPPSEP